VIKKKPGGTHFSLCRSSEAVRLYEGSAVVSTSNPFNPTLTAFRVQIGREEKRKGGNKEKEAIGQNPG
jgi:hypothetical protein